MSPPMTDPLSEPGHDRTPQPRRVMVLGATGTIGQATTAALVERGHEVVCVVRPRAGVKGSLDAEATGRLLAGAQVRIGDVTDPASLTRDGFQGERFDAVVSCLASRTGEPEDAWRIDHAAHMTALAAATAAGVTHFVLLSALCVQKPKLAFQQAKLAFEAALTGSGLRYSIVRPTAYFKSMSGQLGRLKAGKPYLLIGDGRLTATKPISDRDLGRFLAGCLDDKSRWNRILPIGGPGPAITPREQGERLFQLLGQPAKFRSLPPGFLDVIVGVLSAAGIVSPAMKAKSELARIGRYYATESMLVLDSATGRYDAEATPSFGSDTLFDHYAQLVSGEASTERGDHAVF